MQRALASRVQGPLPPSAREKVGRKGPHCSLGQEPSVRRDLAAVEFERQAAVEIDPQMGFSEWTRRVTRARPGSDGGIALILTAKPSSSSNWQFLWGIRVQMCPSP